MRITDRIPHGLGMTKMLEHFEKLGAVEEIYYTELRIASVYYQGVSHKIVDCQGFSYLVTDEQHSTPRTLTQGPVDTALLKKLLKEIPALKLACELQGKDAQKIAKQVQVGDKVGEVYIVPSNGVNVTTTLKPSPNTLVWNEQKDTDSVLFKIKVSMPE